MKIISRRCSKFVILIFAVIVCMFIFFLQNSVSTENKSYEITDYLNILSESNNLEQQQSELHIADEQIAVYYEDEELAEIVLKVADNEAACPWTLYGIRPGMEMEEVRRLLDVTGIITEQHNMQWYATGIELEKKGIQRLSWDPNEQITYVDALIDKEKIEELQDYELEIKEKEYVFCDENRNINIAISYPIIELKSYENIEESVNKNIENVVSNMLKNHNLSEAMNVTINANYTIRNIESECLSIEWRCNYYMEESVTEIRTAITCNIKEGGRLLELTDLGKTKEQIASEIAWREDVDEAAIYDQLTNNYFNYYVTPLHIILFTDNPKTGEQLVTSLWR